MNYKIKMSFVAMLLLFLAACNSKPALNEEEKAAIHEVTAAEFKEKSVNQVLVDIRTPQEFNQGHIEGAVNINYFDPGFLAEMEKFDKTKPLFLYCRSGNRTTSAAAKLSKLGFENIYDLQGGISNWARNNYQINK